MQKKFFLFAFFIAATSWFGLIVEFNHLLTNAAANGFTKPEAIGRFFSYFTILSNLMVAISSTLIFLFPKTATSKFFATPFIMSAITVYIFMVGVGYNVLLRQLWNPQGWHRVSDEILHVVDPLLYVLYWYFFVPKKSLQSKYALQWVALPAVYSVYMLIRGAIDGFYPYSFLDPAKLGYSRMLLNIFGVGIAFVVTGLLFIKFGQWQEKKKNKLLATIS